MRQFALLTWLFASYFLLPVCSAQPLKQSFRVAAEPAWISSVPPSETATPTATNASASPGALYLLLDRQIDLTTESIYTHEAKRITSESGVQNESQLQFVYEPSHQSLEIHKIELRRAGKTQNRLKPESFRVIQQEKDSYRHIYNGEEAVVAILEDVRVGDEIEYSYTVRGFNPIFNGRFVTAMLIQWSVPVLESRIRILTPRNRPTLNVRVHGRDALPLVNDAGSNREFLWIFKDLDPIIPDEQLPDWFAPYPWLQLTEFTSWKDVRDWALPLYEPPSSLSEPLLELVVDLKSKHLNLRSQALAALKFVQEEIRYLGIEIGQNSHKPNDPATVLERRFGDCKDKTVLLVTILRQLGIEAQTAFVNTYLESRVADRLPSPLAFNHVIVRASLDGEFYWLDPTRTHQRGNLRDVSATDYGAALVLTKSDEHLVEIPALSLSGPTKLIEEKLVMPAYEGPATLDVTTLYKGAEANAMRRTLSIYSVEELQKLYLNYYLRAYSGVSNTAPLRIDDDPVSNEVTLREQYSVSEPLMDRPKEHDRYVSFEAFGVTEAAPRPKTYERKMPLRLHYPTHVRHIISIDLPAAGQFPNESKSIQDHLQSFRYDVVHSGKNLLLTYEYQTLKDSVPVAEVPAYLKKLEEIHTTCSYGATFPRADSNTAGGGINWPILALAIMFAGVLCLFAGKYYNYQPALVEGLPPRVDDIDPRLNGLSGWLILVGLGLILSPVGILRTMSETLHLYTPQGWAHVIDSDGPGYRALWSITLIGELLGNLTLLAMDLLLLVLYFQKRATFPRLYIAFLVFNMCFQIADVAALQFIPSLAANLTAQDHRSAVRGVFGAIIWIAYMLKSRRVKATFVR